MLRRSLFVVFSLFIMGNAMASSVPYKLQSAFLFKIFGSDKKLVKIAGEEVKIGIVYNSTRVNSRDSKDGMLMELRKAAELNTLVGLPVSKDLKLIDTSESSWQDMIDGISILYVADSLNEVVDEISSLCKDKQIRTICVDKKYLDRGICSAVVFEAGKPKIYINKKVAKATGVSFNAMVLQYATII